MSIKSSTLLLARLLGRLEGHGSMKASVPVNLPDLARSLQSDAFVIPGYESTTVIKGRIHFPVDPYVAKFFRSLLEIPEIALMRDQIGIRELLARVGLNSIMPINPLSQLEFEYLQKTVGSGTWERLIPMIAEVR